MATDSNDDEEPGGDGSTRSAGSTGAAPAGGSDLRAKDLLNRPREEIEAELDPATLAELASWFELPSAAVVEDEQAAVDAETVIYHEAMARRERAAAAADPAFVHHLERHRRNIPEKPVFEPKRTIDEKILPHFVQRELERIAGDSIADESEYAVPGDVLQILEKHNAPQAILRDLYRPEEEYEIGFQSPFDELPEMDPLRVMREAIRTRITIEWAEPLWPKAMAALAPRAILRESWPAMLPDIHDAVQKRTGVRPTDPREGPGDVPRTK